jgi:hypothetical protein
VLASALCVKCGPTGPPRPSEGEDVGTLGRGTPQRLPKDFLCFLNSFRSSRVEVLPVASEVLRTAEPASTAAPQGYVRPVAQCGPRCRVRRDSTVFPVFYDGLAAQCGPSASSSPPPSASSSTTVFTTSRSSRLRTVYTTSRLRFSFPSLPRCSAWKELQWAS